LAIPFEFVSIEIISIVGHIFAPFLCYEQPH